jgi:2-polyprenyl-3-methyl-5-hydroxy-6-metoxy-1,4-benzoquinol methylase
MQESQGRERVLQVIRAYDDWLVRSYCLARFGILRQRFLDEIGQYLPSSGRILDVGCGFGLFSLYYALTTPRLELHGIDLDSRRIALARAAARRLGITNVHYEVADVTRYASDGRFDAVYMLDIIHHIPAASVAPLIRRLADVLPPTGRLVIKDVDRRPAYKRWFTHALDKLMDRKARMSYWSAEDLQRLLVESGFRVYRHLMVDFLPYPHVIYVCERLEPRAP